MKPNWYLKEVEIQVIPATKEALRAFSRKELRGYAKSIGVEQGRNKSDVIENLIKSGKATMLAQLGD